MERSPPTMPPSELSSSTPRPQSPSQNPPARCFICLTDAEPSDPPSIWVNPCPCTLEAHQDCMMQWVLECERNNRRLQCPVCKAAIHVDGPWDPAIQLSNGVRLVLNRYSPAAVLLLLGAGTAVSLGVYGRLALELFAGKEATLRVLQGNRPGWPGPWNLALPLIAPTVILNDLLPALSRALAVPISVVCILPQLVVKDPYSPIWPPDPRLVFWLFPALRFMYGEVRTELFGKMEAKWDRIIHGLPEPEAPAPGAPAGNDQVPRPGLRGIFGDIRAALQRPNIDVRIMAEEVAANNGGAEPENNENAGQEGDQELGRFELEIVVGDEDEEDEGEADIINHWGVPPPPQNNNLQDDQQQQPDNLPDNAQDQGQQGQQQQDAQVAANRDLQLNLRDLCRRIVTALAFPVVCFGAGEALRLALPRHWTTPTRINTGFWGTRVVHTGLLQERWGRSFTGGCALVVLNDMFQLWTKYRRAKTRDQRKIRNVARQRPGQGQSSS